MCFSRYVKNSDKALEISYDAPSHYHHLCESAMDFHFWRDGKPFLRNGLLEAGRVISGTAATRLVAAEDVAPIFQQAASLELSEGERFFAGLSVYEESVNTFSVSTLERMDAQPWQPMSEGCLWDRNGGRVPGHGCCVIVNERTSQGCWHQDMLRPSQWGNSFVPAEGGSEAPLGWKGGRGKIY